MIQRKLPLIMLVLLTLQACNAVLTGTPIPVTATSTYLPTSTPYLTNTPYPIHTPTAILSKWGDCTQEPNIGNSFNVFKQSFAKVPTIVESGRSYWIRMSIGFVNEGEAGARADQPHIMLEVKMNEKILPMVNDTVIDFNSGAGFWEINSYHCTGDLDPGEYTLVGTSYRNGDYVDSAEFVLLAK